MEEIYAQQIEDFTTNSFITHETIRTLIEHCSTKNMNFIQSFKEINNIYKYNFKQSEDELFDNLNNQGFGLKKKRIPNCSYIKSEEAQIPERKYAEMTQMLCNKSHTSLVVCCLTKKNVMYKYTDNEKVIKDNNKDAVKIESSVIFTCGLNFTSFHIDTYSSKRISVIPKWNRGVYKIWMFFKGQGARELKREVSNFNGYKDKQRQIKYVLENHESFDFYLQKPSDEVALMHDGSYLHSVLTIFNSKVSSYGACLSIGYRLIYEVEYIKWVRRSQPRIGASNTLCSRNTFINAAYQEVSSTRSTAADLMKAMDENPTSMVKKDKKRKKTAVYERLTAAKKARRDIRTGCNNDVKI